MRRESTLLSDANSESMAIMLKRWPTSRWIQAALSFVGSLVASICVFISTNNSLFKQYARENPHDGQDGLAAFMGALEIAALVLVLTFVALYAIQRFLTKARD